MWACKKNTDNYFQIKYLHLKMDGNTSTAMCIMIHFLTSLIDWWKQNSRSREIVHLVEHKDKQKPKRQWEGVI